MEEERENAGSSSDGEEGLGEWIWDGESWWYKVECQVAVNSRLWRRISRSVRATLEQDTKGSGQSELRTSGDLVGFQERGPEFSWREPVSSCDARSWLASVVLRFDERVVRSFGEASETKCANRRFCGQCIFSAVEAVQVCAVMSICGMLLRLYTLPRPWLILVWSADQLEGAQWFAFALGAERAAGLVGMGVCSGSDVWSVVEVPRREAEKSCRYGSAWRTSSNGAN